MGRGLVPAQAITGPLAAAMAPAAAAFARALRDPRRAQEAAFARVRREVRALDGVRTLDELQALPLTRYEDLDVERVAGGARTALTRSPVIRFERSGGSSGAQKLLPMTRPFLEEMNRALQPWLFSLYARTPGVAGGCAYWSVSPLGDRPRETAGGVPIGAPDSAYFPGFLRPLLARVLAVPDDVALTGDVDACRRETARLLAERRDLTLISVWSPTFLTLLLDAVEELQGAPTGVATGRDGGRRPRSLRALWPRLSLVSMWTDASSALFVDDVRARLPGVPIQGKGLLAVEGAVSIPWPADGGSDAPVLAVRSHVLEFLDDDGRACFAHEIEDGRSYEVLLTTSAGLVRYRLGDRVVVAGRAQATPRVRFIGRAMTSDLVGEKLSAAFVGGVVDAAVARVLGPCRARFAMLAPRRPEGSPPHYRLYLECDPAPDRPGPLPPLPPPAARAALARAVEDALRVGHPYRYARELGQLGAVDVVGVVDALRKYERACVARGQRAGDIKAASLHVRDDWDEVLVTGDDRNFVV